jgi:hypothetical protein
MTSISMPGGEPVAPGQAPLCDCDYRAVHPRVVLTDAAIPDRNDFGPR